MPWVSTSSPYWCPLLLSGSTVPVWVLSLSVKMVTWAPSAKRALCVPSGVTSSRPLSLRRVTMQPIVSACTAMARSGRVRRPGSVALSRPRRVTVRSMPRSSSSSPTYCTTSSVRPVGLGVRRRWTRTSWT